MVGAAKLGQTWQSNIRININLLARAGVRVQDPYFISYFILLRCPSKHVECCVLTKGSAPSARSVEALASALMTSCVLSAESAVAVASARMTGGVLTAWSVVAVGRAHIYVERVSRGMLGGCHELSIAALMCTQLRLHETNTL